jgi:hypothetical protein
MPRHRWPLAAERRSPLRRETTHAQRAGPEAGAPARWRSPAPEHGHAWPRSGWLPRLGAQECPRPKRRRAPPNTPRVGPEAGASPTPGRTAPGRPLAVKVNQAKSSQPDSSGPVFFPATSLRRAECHDAHSYPAMWGSWDSSLRVVQAATRDSRSVEASHQPRSRRWQSAPSRRKLELPPTPASTKLFNHENTHTQPHSQPQPPWRHGGAQPAGSTGSRT